MALKHKYLIFLSLLFFTAFLSFGLQISKLGFYLDDWVIVQAFNQDGVDGIVNYAVGDSRPFVAWVWIVGYHLFGSQPLGWQLYALFFRVLTVFAVWLVCNKFFPENPLRSILISILFFIYPIFKQQATSIAFAHHWIAFSFFILSIYLQILAVEKKRYVNLLLLLALILNGIQLFTNEYFIALELSRPLIIGVYICKDWQHFKKEWKKIIWVSLPFILLFVFYFLWRFFFISLPVEDRNTPTMITAIFSTPVYAIRRWTEMLFQSMVEGFLGSWYHALEPANIVFKPFSRAINWILMGISSLTLITAFIWMDRQQTQKTLNEKNEPFGLMIILGLILMILGFVPGWGIGRTIADLSGVYNDRFGLPSALGASLVLVGLIEWMLCNRKVQLGMFAILIGIGVGYQYRIETDYVDSWEQQKTFSWQLLNRAPGIEQNTAIISNRVIAGFVGNWADTSAVNQLYDPEKTGDQNSYWYYTAAKIPFEYLSRNHYSITEKVKFLEFTGNLEDSIVIMNPTDTQCLWVLDKDDLRNPYIDGMLLRYLPFSSVQRILLSGTGEYNEKVWGKLPEENWCYFYEKAELSLQANNYSQVIDFYEQAQKKGAVPGNAVEFSPFIEAYAMEGLWEDAITLTEEALKPIQSPYYPLEAYYCVIWGRVKDQKLILGDDLTQIQNMLDRLNCTGDPE